MSTNANVGYRNKEDRKIHYIYSHWDGYIDSLGGDLFSDYSNYDLIKTLVEKGDMSYIEDHYAERGENFEDVKPRIIEDKNYTPFLEEEYVYLFEDGEWLVKTYSHSWRELGSVL